MHNAVHSLCSKCRSQSLDQAAKTLNCLEAVQASSVPRSPNILTLFTEPSNSHGQIAGI